MSVSVFTGVTRFTDATSSGVSSGGVSGPGTEGAVDRNFFTADGVATEGSADAYTAVNGDVIRFLFSTTSATNQTILDESTGLNRLFCQFTTATNNFTVPTGVTVDVDGGGNSMSADGKLHTVTLTIGAAAAGLVIDTYFKKFDGTEYTNGAVSDIRFSGSENRFYPMSGGQSGGGAIEQNSLNPGTNDMTLVNVVATDWERLTRVGRDWLGAELVVNGGFDTDTDWTKGTGWTISGGLAAQDGTGGSFQAMTQTPVLSVSGQRYLVTFDLVSVFGSAGFAINERLVGAEQWYGTNDGAGRKSRVVTSDGSVPRFGSNGTGAGGSIDNASIRRILEAA